ncbi:hypothetical protein Y919_04515 [Caloranaerobacter azorensis H53214]|uniref:Chromosome partition protein Smc n=2 Tax=Caloranaerobacter azorensis TaxID=116090 RepID=A0A1M5RQE4_9FIRM|nr:chromosome segregation protein SMC [Caloranaerobacter azorensis]KGG80782.1 hypothetical protein Y919_04515 [Caloranaerobacter azorensis H53214]SHH28073.1 condensin subunit Smc [Caloranaerobacter azorensis DSM 13643]
MFLKRIEIQGFKSFADKTDIELSGGITCVVGPNGSGKSNISDAIRWVLGEQSAKTLRGSKMEDVIFSGTSRRKPLGFAEVTLVFDNKDGSLPIDYSEVCITRRLFRSGESEYYINKNSCRLKDIRELFMDTGVGKDGYSIIGQGRIDEILSSKSEDRRNIFEEAAGIVKFKTRKEESEKKLKRTKENIIRINDILNEIEGQLSPLKIQAEKAKRYLELAETLKDLEVNLYLREIDRFKVQIEHIEKQKDVIQEQLKYNEEKREALENKYNEVKYEIEKMEKNIEIIQNNKYDIQNKIEKIDGEIKLCDEKTEILKKEQNKVSNNIEKLVKRQKEIEMEKIRLINDKKELNEKINNLKCELNERLNKLDKLDDEIKSKERGIEDKKDIVIQLLNSITEIKSKINSTKTFIINIDKRIKQIDKEIDELVYKKNDTESEIKNIDSEIQLLNKKLDKITDFKYSLIDDKEKLEKKLKNINMQLEQIKGEIQTKISKYNLLKEMKESYDGFYKSVKNVLKAIEKDRQLGEGVRGVVAELLRVDKKYEIAIEIALGSALQNIVTNSENEAKRIIRYLKENKLGRVTFLPMTSIRGRGLKSDEEEIIKTNGVIGIASKLIEIDEEYREIFEYLLGRVVVVETIDDGIKVSKKLKYSMKVVSLDGEVINPGGSITGGSLSSKNVRLLSRERELNDLGKQIIELKEVYKRLEVDIKNINDKLFKLNYELEESEKDINRLNLNISNFENSKLQKERERQSLIDLIEKYNNEKRQLLGEMMELNKEIETLSLDLQNSESRYNLSKTEVDNLLDNFEKNKLERDDLSKYLTDVKVNLASCEQKMKGIDESILKLDEEYERIANDIENFETELERIKENIEKLQNQRTMFIVEKNELSQELLEYDIRLKEIKSDKNNYMQSFYNEQEKIKEMNKKINDLQSSKNTLDIKLTRYNMQLESYTNKLWDDYELSYQMALKYKKEIENVTKVQNEIRDLKRKIKSLGDVNVSSIEEFERVNERFKFLTEQKNDLIEAEQSLNKVIKDMERKMIEHFNINFEKIRKNFIEVFEKLFGGGKADIYLEDNENVLTSGIEIIAQPPGKKLQSLSLLSGGEKALTAIALLFAILKTKPTPFCVLDEIEAALDEANVFRFADYLKDFSENTQFIVITHRKGTMEAADSLYGVTMEEEGVTKLVSVRLSEKIDEKAS